MFKLTHVELDAAKDAIDAHGYSIYVPTPPEWDIVKNHWDEISDHLLQLDLDTYQPHGPLQLYAPTSRINLRPVALLHPFDLLIYTALTLIAKNDIEAARIAVSEQRVFSNRASMKPNRLFTTVNAYPRYRQRLKTKAGAATTKVVAVTDIADFFPRIYQHRLQAALAAAGKTPRVCEVPRVLVEKFLSLLGKRNSYGIPVGPHSSSLLAEAVLIDVDFALLNAGFDFVRWFDDVHFFCRSKAEAQRALFFLGEWLHTHHGLTLQPAKTKILSRASFVRGVEQTLERRLEKRAKPLVELWSRVQTPYGEFTRSLTADELAEIEAINLQEALKDAFKREQGDYELIQFILGRVATSESIPTEKKLALSDVVLANVAECYPIAATVARFIGSISDVSAIRRKRIIDSLLKPMLHPQHPAPAYYGMWILDVIAEQPEWNHADLVRSIYSQTRADVVRRYALLALAKTGTRNHVLETKTDFENASPLVRTAILFASHRLGSDERKHWRRASVLSDPLEKAI